MGRVTLPEKGVLPPPVTAPGVSLIHVAHDPFAAPFDEDEPPVPVDVRVDVPADELPPIGRELRLPKSLERGLRALGLDPEKVDGADLMLAEAARAALG